MNARAGGKIPTSSQEPACLSLQPPHPSPPLSLETKAPHTLALGATGWAWKEICFDVNKVVKLAALTAYCGKVFRPPLALLLYWRLDEYPYVFLSLLVKKTRQYKKRVHEFKKKVRISSQKYQKRGKTSTSYPSLWVPSWKNGFLAAALPQRPVLIKFLLTECQLGIVMKLPVADSCPLWTSPGLPKNKFWETSCQIIFFFSLTSPDSSNVFITAGTSHLVYPVCLLLVSERGLADEKLFNVKFKLPMSKLTQAVYMMLNTKTTKCS